MINVADLTGGWKTNYVGNKTKFAGEGRQGAMYYSYSMSNNFARIMSSVINSKRDSMYKHLTKVCFFAGSLALALGVPPAFSDVSPDYGPVSGGGSPSMVGNSGAFDATQLPPDLLRLNLSEEQKAKISEVIQNHNKALHDSFTTAFNSHEALRNLALSPEYTEAKAKSLSQEGVKAMAETAQIHSRIDNAIYQLLNPQQQQQWKQDIANFEQRMPKPE